MGLQIVAVSCRSTELQTGVLECDTSVSLSDERMELLLPGSKEWRSSMGSKVGIGPEARPVAVPLAWKVDCFFDEGISSSKWHGIFEAWLEKIKGRVSSECKLEPGKHDNAETEHMKSFGLSSESLSGS